uniref:ATPase n=1 Tax=Thaumasiovibrio occultus TaxID=1891184 RepID=UPI000B362572|nr:ATPase [Thaumasiovibrio occultus]
MNDTLDLLNQIGAGAEKEAELPERSIEEQRKIVAELKRLEEAGELTPELLQAYMTGEKTVD